MTASSPARRFGCGGETAIIPESIFKTCSKWIRKKRKKKRGEKSCKTAKNASVRRPADSLAKPPESDGSQGHGVQRMQILEMFLLMLNGNTEQRRTRLSKYNWMHVPKSKHPFAPRRGPPPPGPRSGCRFHPLPSLALHI